MVAYGGRSVMVEPVTGVNKMEGVRNGSEGVKGVKLDRFSGWFSGVAEGPSSSFIAFAAELNGEVGHVGAGSATGRDEC